MRHETGRRSRPIKKAIIVVRREFTVPELMEIYIHWQAGDSLRQLSKNLGVDRATLRHYITAATAAGIEQGTPR